MDGVPGGEEQMKAIERADELMNRWFGHRWDEDSFRVNIWSAITNAIEAAEWDAVEVERTRVIGDAKSDAERVRMLRDVNGGQT
mgnify:CR=1 FL=1